MSNTNQNGIYNETLLATKKKKKKEILPLATTQMDLEGSMLTSKPDAARRRLHDPPCVWDPKGASSQTQRGAPSVKGPVTNFPRQRA